MGNCLRFLFGFFKPDPSSRPDAFQPQYLGPHGVTSVNVGVSALAHDILNFDSTSQVPDGLSRHVVSSKNAQANWYRKLSDAWKNAKPPPRSPEEAARLVILTLKRHQKADVQGLLRYYGLPYLTVIDLTDSDEIQSSLPQGAQYKFETLPVDARAVADGDTITVYVNTASPRESSIIPREVLEGTVERARARAARDFKTADAILKTIVDAGYRFLPLPGTNNEEILAHKYRIRLRGIDAPENSMPYGKEAKEELLKLVQGKCLTILVYDEDRYGRTVGDIYCNGVFVQEVMLKKGCAWHYTAYDKRPEFAEWEKSARAARRGLWTAKNPEKPWDYRRDRRNGV